LTITSIKTWVATGINGAQAILIGLKVGGIWVKDGMSETRLTVTDATGLTDFGTGDAITEVTAAGVAGDATGTVFAVDATTKTITLSATTGTWDVGSAVKGPLKASATSVKMFCKLNPTLTVTDLQSADPGYTAVTGAGPYTVTFPATLPTGAAPDVDLPAGTSLTTEVQATNSSGTVTKTSNTVTPA
jgi:hypothetical protein